MSPATASRRSSHNCTSWRCRGGSNSSWSSSLHRMVPTYVTTEEFHQSSDVEARQRFFFIASWPTYPFFNHGRSSFFRSFLNSRVSNTATEPHQRGHWLFWETSEDPSLRSFRPLIPHRACAIGHYNRLLSFFLSYHGRRQRGGCALRSAPGYPPVVVRKIICALSFLPVHCRSVKFM